MSSPARERLDRYEHRTTIPLLILAGAFLVLYALPIVWPSLPPGLALGDELLSFAVWVVFVCDLGLRAYLSGSPGQYLMRHPIDFLLVALPMLRPLRVLRVFTAANYVISRGGRFAIGRTVAAAVAATALLLLVAALAMLDTERDAPGTHVSTIGDALWWAGATVTTVGYGDVFPVTPVGRVVAFALMLVGISMLGVITAAVAAWFVQRTRQGEDELLTEMRAQRELIEQLMAEVSALKPSAELAEGPSAAAKGQNP